MQVGAVDWILKFLENENFMHDYIKNNKMGKPPPHTIFRKIVKNYFKKTLPYNLSETVVAFDKLNACWDKFGHSSDQCRELEVVYEETLEKDALFKKYIKNMKYPQ